MTRLIVDRKLPKTYLLLIPFVLYMCVMYRMLETTCFDGSRQHRQVGSYVPSETKTRKIMQFRFQNNSSLLAHLAQEYENIERERSYLLHRMQTALVMTGNDPDTSSLNRNLDPYFDTSAPGFNAADSYRPSIYPLDTSMMRPRYPFNCSNTYLINLQRKIGHGVSKQTFRGDYFGQGVAVKMVTRNQVEVKTCLEKIPMHDPKKEEKRSHCFVHSTMKLMKEILLLEQLNHPGFTRLLGYCIRSEESDTSDLSERGVVSVFELGQRFVVSNLQMLTWRERLKHSIWLADFLNYLEHSPLGSLRVRDFKEGHFLMVNDTIKMIDLDDVDNLEPSCHTYVNVESQKMMLHGNGCEFGLPCQRGLCVGFNAKQNMKYMNRLFFKRLLYPSVYPAGMVPVIGALNVDIDNDAISAAELRNKLMHLYDGRS